MAYCSSLEGEQLVLGYYKTPHDAFSAHKSAKEAVIRQLAETWKGRISTPVYNALMKFSVEP